MRTATDIPDWIFTEGIRAYDYNFSYFGDDRGIYFKFLERSPIRYIDAVKTPVLLMVGGSDLRVPPGQSIEYYKALTARNRIVKMLFYKDDNHTLGRTQTTADCIVSTVLWYEKYLQ